MTDEQIDAYWELRSKELVMVKDLIVDLFLSRKIAVAESLYIMEIVKSEMLTEDEEEEY